MPRASSRSSVEASWSSLPEPLEELADRGGVLGAAGAARPGRRATSATSRCCAPSCRSRSILRRAASAASRMRWREARSSAVRASSTLCASSAASAARRSVMSNIAPSSHSRPPGPGTGCPRSSTQRTSPSARTIRYSSTNGSSRLGRVRDGLEHDLDVVGVDDREDRALAGGEEARRRVAGDPLDLVADHLEQEVRRATRSGRSRPGRSPSASAAARSLARCSARAQPGARPSDQLGAGERAVQVVVGARVEHRVGHPALGGDGDRQQPGVAEPRVVAQRGGRPRGASSPDESRSTMTRSTGSSSSAAPAATAADRPRSVPRRA